MSPYQRLNKHIQTIEQHYSNMPQFIQAVHEVGDDVARFIQQSEQPHLWRAFTVLTEPDRIIQFRVDWENDNGEFQSNRGYRVQFNNTLGPYKGGLRFTPNTKIDELMFLGFEQTFKNSLTGLPMGGAKGGADFDPKNCSESEIRRFCQAFMTQLAHHIGPDKDIPAGDIGVGTREIGYMFHQYKNIENEFKGILTGKHPTFGGSCIREEATGFGCVYFSEHMLAELGQNLNNKVCCISGAGNVALYTAKKLLQRGAKVITLSDSRGVCYFQDGLTDSDLEKIIEGRQQRKRLSDIDEVNGDYIKDEKPWQYSCDLVFPCATQNEIDGEDAVELIKHQPLAVVEGANMPCSDSALDLFEENDVLVGPSKAVNAGGVAVSGLEISQNRSRLSWEATHVDERLQQIMKQIHEQCKQHGKKGERIDYRQGANIAAFLKLSQALSFTGLLAS